MANDESAANGTEIDLLDEPYVPTSWEFPDEPPGTAQVMDKLRLIVRWGLDFSHYVEYVQPLGQSKNVSTDKKRKDYKTVYTLYVTVAGRISMANDLAVRNDWRIDFVPEPVTPTGIPGYLVWSEKHLVYREYAEIWEKTADGERLLGRKPGTASVPATGGSGAVESSRFEKVETSARGRALGAWGIGVLPGSGVASYEEMREVQRQQNATEFQQQYQAPAKKPIQNRDELMSKLRVSLAEYQDASGMTWEEVFTKAETYVKNTFSKQMEYEAEGIPAFGNLKDGEVEIMARAIGKQAAGIRVQKESIG